MDKALQDTLTAMFKSLQEMKQAIVGDSETGLSGNQAILNANLHTNLILSDILTTLRDSLEFWKDREKEREFEADTAQQAPVESAEDSGGDDMRAKGKIGEFLEGIGIGLTTIATGLTLLGSPRVILGIVNWGLFILATGAALALLAKFAGPAFVNFIHDLIVGIGSALIELLVILGNNSDAIMRVVDIVIHIVDGLLEAIGSFLIQIQPLIEGILEIFLDFVLALSEDILDTFERIVELLVDAFKYLVDALPGIIKALTPIIELFVGLFEFIVDKLPDIIRALTPIFDRILDAFDNLIDGIVEVVRILQPIIRDIIGMVETLIDTIGDIVSDIAGVFTTLIGEVQPILNELEQIIDTVLSNIANIIDTIGDQIQDIITTIGTEVSRVVSTVGGEIQGIIDSIFGDEEGNGGIQGVIKRIKELIVGVVDSIADAVSRIASAIGTEFRANLEAIGDLVERMSALGGDENNGTGLFGTALGLAAVAGALGLFGGVSVLDAIGNVAKSGLDALARFFGGTDSGLQAKMEMLEGLADMDFTAGENLRPFAQAFLNSSEDMATAIDAITKAGGGTLGNRARLIEALGDLGNVGMGVPEMSEETAVEIARRSREMATTSQLTNLTNATGNTNSFNTNQLFITDPAAAEPTVNLILSQERN